MPETRSLRRWHQQSILFRALGEGRAQLGALQQQTMKSHEPSCEVAGVLLQTTKAISDVCERHSQTLLEVEMDSEAVCQLVRRCLDMSDFCRDQDTSTERQLAATLPSSLLLVAQQEDSHGRDLTKEMNS